MLPFLTKESKIKLRILAWYQIVGGIAGLIATVWVIFKVSQFNGLLIAAILFAFALFVFSIYCGRLLLGDNYLTGFKFTIINQILQSINFAIRGYAFLYASGAMFTVGMDMESGLDIKFALISTWNISLATSDTTLKVAVNLIALYIIYFSEKLRSNMAREKARFEALKIRTESMGEGQAETE